MFIYWGCGLYDRFNHFLIVYHLPLAQTHGYPQRCSAAGDPQSMTQAWHSLRTVLTSIKWLFIEEVVYYSVHWVIKSAFLLFYLRLSPSPTFRIAVYIGGALNGAILIINMCVIPPPSARKAVLNTAAQSDLTLTAVYWHASNAFPLTRSSTQARIQMLSASANLSFS